jgi:SAM-dependent methyltransferase
VADALVYRSPVLYELAMLGLYGRHYADRHRTIAELIPAGSSVLDLCCGPGTLFERHLRRKGVEYTGLDVNSRFVARVARLGGRGLAWDLRREDPLPRADVVLMAASLYHFLPDPAPVVERMCRAARRRVIISEPIRNLTNGRHRLLGRLARRLTAVGDTGERRFTEQSLDRFVAALPRRPSLTLFIPGGREKVHVFDGG